MMDASQFIRTFHIICFHCDSRMFLFSSLTLKGIIEQLAIEKQGKTEGKTDNQRAFLLSFAVLKLSISAEPVREMAGPVMAFCF